jgi:hypothetical protein
MEAAAAVVGFGAGAGLTRWQAAALSAVAGWVWAASFYDLTRRARALVQPWVTRRVHAETAAILRFQVRPLRVNLSPPLRTTVTYFLLISIFSDEQINCITMLRIVESIPAVIA